MDSDKVAEPVLNEALPNNVTEDKDLKDDVDEASSPKIAKLDEAESSGRKGRNSAGARKKSKRTEDELIAEAKAVCGGELDTSEGRRLRKRSDPAPKVVEEKKKPTPKRNTRKKPADKAEENGDQNDSITEEKEEKSIPEKDTSKESKPENGEKVEKNGAEEEENNTEMKDESIEMMEVGSNEAKEESKPDAAPAAEENGATEATNETAEEENKKTDESKESE